MIRKRFNHHPQGLTAGVNHNGSKTGIRVNAMEMLIADAPYRDPASRRVSSIDPGDDESIDCCLHRLVVFLDFRHARCLTVARDRSAWRSGLTAERIRIDRIRRRD